MLPPPQQHRDRNVTTGYCDVSLPCVRYKVVAHFMPFQYTTCYRGLHCSGPQTKFMGRWASNEIRRLSSRCAITLRRSPTQRQRNTITSWVCLKTPQYEAICDFIRLFCRHLFPIIVQIVYIYNRNVIHVGLYKRIQQINTLTRRSMRLLLLLFCAFSRLCTCGDN